MNNNERMLPRSLKPISAWGYFWYSVLYTIPVIGWIFLIVNAIGAPNRHARSFARSYFCKLIILILLLAVVAGVTALLFMTKVLSWDEIKAIYEDLKPIVEDMINVFQR